MIVSLGLSVVKRLQLEQRDGRQHNKISFAYLHFINSHVLLSFENSLWLFVRNQFFELQYVAQRLVHGA